MYFNHFLGALSRRTRRAALLLLAAPLFAACASRGAPATAASATVASQPQIAASEWRFQRLSEDFLAWYYEANPTRATRLGIHTHDGRLPDMSRVAIQRRAGELRSWLQRLEEIDRSELRGDAYFDHRVLEYAVRAQLLELEEVQSWRKDPGSYSGIVAGSLAGLASRDFAPVEERMRAMIARMNAVPLVFAAARANLVDVPRLWAEQAVRGATGTARFVREDLPRALQAQGVENADPALREELARASEHVIGEIESYARWVERDLLPRANGDFRLGRDVFERKVRYEEHVELSAEQLREMNERAIVDYKRWVERVARDVDPSRSPTAIMDSITGNHPSSAELIPTARRMQEEIRDFIIEQGILTLPSDARPTVRETPAYARGGFASMDAPGPFETRATEAFYNITNVESGWTAEQQAQHLTYFNYPGLLGITIHESFPGHFVQLLYRPRIPTDVRKVFQPGSLVEGWAHYTEQMMVDEGLGADDLGVRLGQLRRALQRHARWYAGLEMHAFGESIEDATRRYMDIAYFAEFPARREVERGTSDATYLYYALGRMQILRLRDDYRRHVESRGEAFSLRDFHDRFLRLGLPVELAREVLIPHSAGGGR